MSLPITYGWIDHTNERTKTTLHLEEIAVDGSNWGALVGVGGNADLVKAALVTISKLNHTKTTVSVKVDQSVESIPADPAAQRELAARFLYTDNVTGKKYRFDVPAPADLLLQSGTDVIDLVANVEAAAFKAIIEANCVSEFGNPITIYSARLVGRRN